MDSKAAIEGGKGRTRRKLRYLSKHLTPNSSNTGTSTGRSRSNSRLSHRLSRTRKADDRADETDAASVRSARSEKGSQLRFEVAEIEIDSEETIDDEPNNETDDEIDESNEIDMWAEAENKLREDPKKRAKLDEYDRILAERFGEPLKPIGTPARRRQFQLFFDREMEEHAAKERADVNGAYKDMAGRIIKAAAKAIMTLKDIVGPATSACLPAGVACTGFVVVVSFCLKASEQRDQLFASLDEISGSICRISEYEILCRREPAETRQSITSFNETKTAFVQACSNILEFQARVLCYLEKKAVKRIVRDIFDWDAWSGLLKGIRDAEDRILRCAQRHDMGKTLLIYSRLNTLTIELQRQNQESNTERFDKRANPFLALLYDNTCRYRETKARNQKHVPGTCKWFTQHTLFTDWRAGTGTSNVLHVTADPGCGKSVLSAYLVDSVLSGGDEAVCYFFFKDDFADQKTASGALCAILHQLFDQNRSLLTPDILNRYEAFGEKIVGSVPDLWELLVQAASIQKVVCVLDALDECYNEDMGQLVRTIMDKRATGIKFLLTSRPYAYIRRAITLARPYNDNDDTSHVHLQGDGEESASQIAREITLVIDARVNDIAISFWLDEDERQIIRDQLLSAQNRTYLWVALVFDGLLEKREGITKADILALTERLPNGIYAAYERILEKSQDRVRAKRLLQIIIAAQRPLTLVEVSVALELCDPEHVRWEEVRDMIVPESRAKEAIRNLCGMFVTVIDSRVYLLHQTAREFLLYNRPTPAPAKEDKVQAVQHGCGVAIAWIAHVWALLLALLLRVVHPLLHQLWLFTTNSWQHSMDLTTSNEILAIACMACLQPEFSRNKNRSLFLCYAAQYWASHYRCSGPAFQRKMATAAHDLCVDSAPNWRWIRQAYLSKNETGLLLASHLGLGDPAGLFIQEIMSSTETSVVDEINKRDRLHGQTSLSVAAEEGHAKIVQLLLTTGKANLEAGSSTGTTALSFAAGNGHVDVVQLLLAKKAKVDTSDAFGMTPLSYAARYGRHDIVQLLLNGYTTVDEMPIGGRTALSHAAETGNRKTVQLLLAKQAQVDAKDEGGRTPLFYAAQYGHTDVMHLLLAKNADVNAKDAEDGTPLTNAIIHGQKDAVQLLLSMGADVDIPGDYERAPLLEAASRGHDGIVKLLLEWGADVNTEDRFGWMPVSEAAQNGYTETVRLLLENNAEVDERCPQGRTSLSYAAEYGYKEVVRLLLGKNAMVDSHDARERTPLFYAAAKGYASVVEMLLGTGKVDTSGLSFVKAMEEAKQRQDREMYDLLAAYAADESVRESSLSDTPTLGGDEEEGVSEIE